MTNFEIITQNPETLEEFICVAQDDALEAEGCSIKLNLPPQNFIDWGQWLNKEAEENGECVYLPHNKTIYKL